MRIDSQKFMLRQLEKEYMDFTAYYEPYMCGAEMDVDEYDEQWRARRAEHDKKQPTFEEWLTENNLLEGEE